MSYNVLNYRLVCDAFFNLRATYAPLPDGNLTVCIHGLAGDERLSLSVRDGVPSVLPSEPGREPELELTHVEAMELLFAPFSPGRRKLSPAVQAWLPLPIWMYKADEV